LRRREERTKTAGRCPDA